MPTELKREITEDGSTSPSNRRRIDDPDKPMYLVVEHVEEKQPAYSIRNVGATTKPVVPLRYSQRGMSFAAVSSPQGFWIVGVGGDDGRHTTIYDVAASKEWHGPALRNCMMEPVLIPFRGQLYVLSRRPSVKRGTMCLDFLPWFQRICFKDGRPRWDARCKNLEPPPIFPCRINPLEYKDPPEIRVASYATVGSRILLSVQLENVSEFERKYMGTCGYDMERDVWEMVHEKNLPFLGQAVPLGENLFLARSKVTEGAAVVYSMEVGRSTSGTSELSIREVKVVVAPKGRIVLGELFFPLGTGRFSSVCVRSVDPGPESKLEKRVVHRNYAVVSYDAAESSVTIAKQHRQVYQLVDRSLPLVHPAPVVAAFTM